MNRYHRQTLHIGAEGQHKLAQAAVLVVGAGGLGCPALLYLAGAGIGRLGIIDPDRVELSNLHRQVLFTPDDIGRNKAEAAREKLAALNPEITLRSYNEALTAQNAAGICSDYDLILDGTDNFAAKYVINDTAALLGKPVIYGAMQGSEGRVAHFDAAYGACYRCVYPESPQASIRNCAEAGIIGALAGVIGAAQAVEAIHSLIGQPALRSRLWLFDSASMESRRLTLEKRVDCPACKAAKTGVMPPVASPACAMAEVREISADAVGDALLLDVREREEWDEGHLPQAEHLPLSAIQRNPECFAPWSGQKVVLYCQRGTRSKTAGSLLLRSGFTGISSLRGGIENWPYGA